MINPKSKEPTITLWMEVLIFISSYYPLFVILFIKDLGNMPDRLQFGMKAWNLSVGYTSVILLTVSSIATIIISPLIRCLTTHQQGGITITITDCRQVKGDMLNYTLPFLIGLFGFNYDSFQSILSLFVFLLFMFAFIHKEQIYLLNPIFLLLNIRLYNIHYKEVGRNLNLNKVVLCLGFVYPSKETVKLKENSGINFIYPNKKQ